MMSSTLTRRALLACAGTVAASAALAIPYVNAAHADDVCHFPVEPGNIPDQLERVTRQLSALMSKYLNGQFKAVVGPDGEVAFVPARNSPERRLRAAALEVKAAMVDLGCDDYMVFIKHWSGEHTATAIEFLSPDCKTSRSYPLA